MLVLSEGDEEEFIATQAAAGNPVGKQSARDVQKNVKAFKQLRTAKKLHDDRADVPDEESNDTPVIVDRDVASYTLPVIDTLPVSTLKVIRLQ